MTTFMPPPPASTFLAFHPQDNNIIAIGMEDSTIHIYNVRVDEVTTEDCSFFIFYIILSNAFGLSIQKVTLITVLLKAYLSIVFRLNRN